jgi:AraC family transcriptional regulator
MDVRIVTFPETQVASITHAGPPEAEHATVRKLVAWKLDNRLLDPVKNRSYGLHYTDPRVVKPEDHRVDFCLSFDGDVAGNPHGIERKIIPRMRCAYARDIGSRLNNQAAAYLYDTWLPSSGEELSGYPIIFHYVNVGPNVKDEEAVTDVYMPLK